jgi:hypothetical protein
MTTLSSTTRSKYLRETIDELAHKEKQKKHHEEALHRLQYEKQPFSVKKLVEQTRERIASITAEIAEIEAKQRDIEQGLLDEEFKREIEQNRATATQKGKTTLAKKAAKNPPPVGRLPFKPRERNMDRDSSIEYDRYMRLLTKFPDSLRDRLKKMPNNRGFLWRDIAFYGELAPTSDVTVLSERREVGGKVEFWDHKFKPGFPTGQGTTISRAPPARGGRRPRGN